MRHRNKNKILGREKAPRELMLRNLASSILLYEKVKTTHAKALAVRPLVERLITVAKAGNLTARRRLLQVLLQKNAVKKTMDILGKRYQDRPGGYTRISKLGTRAGDGASMVQIELVAEKDQATTAKVEKNKTPKSKIKKTEIKKPAEKKSEEALTKEDKTAPAQAEKVQN